LPFGFNLLRRVAAAKALSGSPGFALCWSLLILFREKGVWALRTVQNAGFCALWRKPYEDPFGFSFDCGVSEAAGRGWYVVDLAGEISLGICERLSQGLLPPDLIS
jgi:hypothetical protein